MRVSLDALAAAALPAAFALAFGLRLAWLLAAVVHGALPIDNEGAEYARIADNVRAGVGYVGLHGTFQAHAPPLYPLLMALLSPLTGSAELAGRLISLIAGALLVVPVYALARAAYGTAAAGWAAMTVAVLPFLVQISTAVLSESLFATLAITGLAFLVAAVRTRSPRAAVLCGIALGAATLTRHEAIAWVALAVGIVTVATWWQTRRVGRAAIALLAVLLPVVLMVGPYDGYVMHETGHFGELNKTSGVWSTGVRMMAGMSYEQASLLLGPNLEPLGAELSDYSFDQPSAGPHSLQQAFRYAAYTAPRHAAIIRWSLHEPAFGGWLGAALILVGLFAPPWRRRARYEALFLGFFGLAFVTILATPLFEDRYLIEFVPFTALWMGRAASLIAAAIVAAVRRSGNTTLAASLGGIAAVAAITLAFVVTLNGAARAAAVGRADMVDRETGAWIARNAPGAAVMDERTAIPYYAHASRWINFPWGDSSLVLRYIAKQRPDVIVLFDPPAQNVPYLAEWARHGIPDSDVCLATVFRAPQRSAEIYLRHPSGSPCRR